MKRYFSFLVIVLVFQGILFGMTVILQRLATLALPAVLELAIAYQHKQQNIQLPAQIQNGQQASVSPAISTQPTQCKTNSQTLQHQASNKPQLNDAYYTASQRFTTPQSERSAFSISFGFISQDNYLQNLHSEQRFLNEAKISLINARVAALLKQNTAFKQLYVQQVDLIAHLIIGAHSPDAQVRWLSRIILVTQPPFYGPHYDGLRQAFFALLPPICDKDGALQLMQHVENAHLDVAKGLRELFINDQNAYVFYLERACQERIPGMEKVLLAELQNPGSTGIHKSWSDILKIFWFNKTNLFNKARDNAFNKDMFTVVQLFQQDRVFEAERLFKQHASMQMWMEDPEKHAKLYQFFFSFSNQYDITYGILNKYIQDPFWKSYPNKQILQKDFLDYRDNKISYPASLKARDNLKQACIQTHALTEAINDVQLNDFLYKLVDLGGDCQKHVEFLYDCFYDTKSPYHATIKKYFFNDQGLLKIAENNSAWYEMCQTAQHKVKYYVIELLDQGELQESKRLIDRISDKQERADLQQLYEKECASICLETGIKKLYMNDPWWKNFAQKDTLRQQYQHYAHASYGSIPEDIASVNRYLAARHGIITNLREWSKLPADCPAEITSFLYHLIDTAPDLTSCIEGLNSLLLNVHDPKNAPLAACFFNDEGILRMYEDDARAKQFEVNRALSWAVQRQITEYANKILSLKISEQDPSLVHDQLDRAWNYICAAGIAVNDDQALVYAYIADGIFQALHGSEFHSDLFKLPYLFDYGPESYEYAVNEHQFQKIARILSLHEAQKNGILFHDNGGDFPELPQNNNNGGPNQSPPLPPGQGSPNNNDKDPKNNIIVPAVVAKELCEHHEVIDEAELALIQWFNKLDIAIKNNIRLADNFFTHIRYGSWIDKIKDIKGAHTESAQCCFDFKLIRTISGGHNESYGKFLYQGVEKTSSIFKGFDRYKLLEQIIKALESGVKQVGPSITSDKTQGIRRVIEFKMECGMQYLLQATNGKVFDTCCPSISFMRSIDGQNLAECVKKCL